MGIVRMLSIIPLLALLFGFAPAAFAQDLDVRIVSVTSPVSPGSQAALIVRTDSGAMCTPTVSGPRNATLGAKHADAHGLVRWRIQVPHHTAAGHYRLTVACSLHDRQGSVERSIVVQ